MIFKATLTKETEVDLRILRHSLQSRILTDHPTSHLTCLVSTKHLQEVTYLAPALRPLKIKMLRYHHQTSLNKRDRITQVLCLLGNQNKTLLPQ